MENYVLNEYFVDTFILNFQKVFNVNGGQHIIEA